MAKKARKTLDQYAFGTGLSSVGAVPSVGGILGDLGSDFLMQQAVSGIGTILGGAKKSNPSLDFLTDQTGGLFALGGIVGGNQVEVEGDEVAETPAGQLMQFDGPSHEQGGIDANLPSGTKIFSDRIAIDGKTMQERKKRRESRMKKLLNAGETTVDKNTANRTQKFLDMEEEGDLMVQEAANQANTRKFAYGTGGAGIPDLSALLGLTMPGILGNIPNAPLATPPYVAPEVQTKVSIPATGGAGVLGEQESATALPFSVGDITGMIGNAMGGIAPLATTLANRAGDTPNVSKFKDFGNDALMANSNAKGQLAGIRDNNLESIQLQKTASRARNRNSAGSVNTLRALDFATDAQGTQAEAGVENSYASSLMNLFGQQSMLENQQDQVVMGGEQAADLANRQDRDAYYTSLGDGFTNLSAAAQKTGQDLNSHQMNQDILDLLPELSKYGVGVVRGKNGKLQTKKVK